MSGRAYCSKPGIVLFLIFWWGAIGTIMFFVARDAMRGHRAAKTFATAAATVVESRVEQHSGSEGGPTYSPRIIYRYQVGGRWYTSNRYEFAQWSTSSSSRAKRIVGKYPPGAQVVAHYDPADPSTACLRVGVPSMTWLLVVFFQPFILIGLGVPVWLVAGAWRARKVARLRDGGANVPCDIPGWGVLEQAGPELVLRRRIGLAGCARVFAIAYGAACLAGLVVLAMGLAGEILPRQALAVLAGAAGVGALAVPVHVRSVRRKATLTLDTQLRQLRLESPVRSQIIPLDRIDRWVVRSIPWLARARSQTTALQGHVLAVRTSDQQEVPVHVFGPEGEGDVVAEVASALLGRLTGKPSEGPQESSGPELSLPEPSLSGAIDLARQSWRQLREYRDLT